LWFNGGLHASYLPPPLSIAQKPHSFPQPHKIGPFAYFFQNLTCNRQIGDLTYLTYNKEFILTRTAKNLRIMNTQFNCIDFIGRITLYICFAFAIAAIV